MHADDVKVQLCFGAETGICKQDAGECTRVYEAGRQNLITVHSTLHTGVQIFAEVPFHACCNWCALPVCKQSLQGPT